MCIFHYFNMCGLKYFTCDAIIKSEAASSPFAHSNVLSTFVVVEIDMICAHVYLSMDFDIKLVFASSKFELFAVSF